MATETKRRLCDDYWRAYFTRLDRLAPHASGTFGHTNAQCRRVFCWHCKDGVLFTFAPGQLQFGHKSTTKSVEATLFALSSHMGGIRIEPFPDHADFGLSAAQLSPDDSGEANIISNRVTWFRSGATSQLTSQAAVAAAEEHHTALVQKEAVGEAPTKKR